MGYDGWVTYDGVELFNLSRTAQLAQTLGVDTVWVSPDEVSWIQTATGEFGYSAVENAPWFDAQHPASAELAGFIPLGLTGLDDSTRQATTTEYITDGGRSGRSRNGTLSMVASVAIVARTDRGADYGKRWLDRMLASATGNRTFCAGSDLHYFQYAAGDAPVVHRRQVRLTRGVSVTRKRVVDCSSTWLVTFTLTADDPFEYGEAVPRLEDLGGAVSGAGVVTSGQTVLLQEDCPAYDYSPVYDPDFPALVPAPAPPNFYPAGWNAPAGATFDRFWARISPVEPSSLGMVPVITFNSSVEARMVRVSIWPNDSPVTDQCDPLFSVTLTYLPAGVDLYVDGEQQAVYIWGGFSPAVRRADTLAYGPDATPIEWSSFNDHTSLLVTLDVFTDSGSGSGEVRADLALVPKSD